MRSSRQRPRAWVPRWPNLPPLAANTRWASMRVWPIPCARSRGGWPSTTSGCGGLESNSCWPTTARRAQPPCKRPNSARRPFRWPSGPPTRRSNTASSERSRTCPRSCAASSKRFSPPRRWRGWWAFWGCGWSARPWATARSRTSSSRSWRSPCSGPKPFARVRRWVNLCQASPPRRRPKISTPRAGTWPRLCPLSAWTTHGIAGPQGRWTRR